MVHEVLGTDKCKTYLDFRPSEPTWIQFKFHRDEFDIEKLDSITRDSGIITKSNNVHMAEVINFGTILPLSRLKDGQVVESEYVSLREGDIIQRNGSHLIILGNSYYFDDLSENDKLLISIKIRILPEGTTIML